MDYYFVLKNTGRGNARGRSCVVTPVGKKGNLRVVGNIPELYHGMSIQLSLGADNYVKDYRLDMTPKNRAAIEKAGFNPDEYADVLKRHTVLKKMDLGWNVARLDLEELYTALPFSEADTVHKEFIGDKDEPTRVTALNHELIKKARLKKQIAYNIQQYLSLFDSVENLGAYEHLAIVTKMMCVQKDCYNYNSGIIWDKEMRTKEEYVDDNISARLTNQYELMKADSIIKYIASVKDNGLTDEQLNVLWCLRNSKPCIVTGGAGTGKTTVIKTVVEYYKKTCGLSNILLAAPTGKAARRLAEKTGLKTATIHKALRKNPEDDYVFFNESNPLQQSLVIIDESSMIDTELMYNLLNAVKPTSKIIFVGDCNQLEPVGYGEPFEDFMNKLEVFRLTVNHRQKEGTSILDAAEKALNGQEVRSGKGVKVLHINLSDIPEIVQQNVKRNTQIITPYNDLNRAINDYLRKDSDDFAIGDKVIMIKNANNYSNGDIGYVEKFDDKGNMYVLIDNKSIKVTEAHFKEVQLAYAITVHKMQGSEMSKILLFIPEKDTFVTNKMLYTAITRAKDEIEIYFYDKNDGKGKK